MVTKQCETYRRKSMTQQLPNDSQKVENIHIIFKNRDYKIIIGQVWLEVFTIDPVLGKISHKLINSFNEEQIKENIPYWCGLINLTIEWIDENKKLIERLTDIISENKITLYTDIGDAEFFNSLRNYDENIYDIAENYVLSRAEDVFFKKNNL